MGCGCWERARAVPHQAIIYTKIYKRATVGYIRIILSKEKGECKQGWNQDQEQSLRSDLELWEEEEGNLEYQW